MHYAPAEMELTFAQSLTVTSLITSEQIVIKMLRKEPKDRDKVRGGTRKRMQDSGFHSNLAR